MTALELMISGIAAPQGSKKIGKHRRTGAPLLIDDNKSLKAWRERAEQQLRKAWAGRAPISSAVYVSLSFYLPRPAGHYGTGRNAGILRPSAPLWPAVRPDNDKLQRAVFDALQASGVLEEDSRVVGVTSWKNYADAIEPGVRVSVSLLEGAGNE